MPRDNCESGFSRCLVAENAAIDREEILLAESSSERAESARKLLCTPVVIAVSCGHFAKEYAGERAAQRLDSFCQFESILAITASPPQQSFVKDEQRVAWIRLQRAIIDR